MCRQLRRSAIQCCRQGAEGTAHDAAEPSAAQYPQTKAKAFVHFPSPRDGIKGIADCNDPILPNRVPTNKAKRAMDLPENLKLRHFAGR